MKISGKNNIAHHFNNFFINVGKKLTSSFQTQSYSFDKYLSKPNLNSFFARSTTPHEILQLSYLLKVDKSSGPDSFSPKVVKNCINSFANPLCDIFNKSLSSGIVPNKLKVAKIVPLHKKNDINNVENYRPIALLSVFAKLLEKVMHKRLYDFLLKCDILTSKQFGFRRNYSTDLSIVNFTNDILREITNGMFCYGVFMDLSKAFDTIDHHILL